MTVKSITTRACPDNGIIHYCMAVADKSPGEEHTAAAEVRAPVLQTTLLGFAGSPQPCMLQTSSDYLKIAPTQSK
jgi:hypothetical protein